MRKLIVTELVSLDGVNEAPEKWSIAYWNDEIARFKHDELFASGAMLLGRRTYETFAGSWPGRKDETGFADRMNSLPKHVVSSTLQDLEWNNAWLVEGDVAKTVSELKKQKNGDLLVYGSGSLVQTLLKHGLVDECRLIVYPLVLGTGKRLFSDGAPLKLNLQEARPFSSGAVLLRYAAGAS